MVKRHLFVMDPIDKINPYTDSTYDVMLECQSRQDEVWECTIKQIFVNSGIGFSRARRIILDSPTKEINWVTYKTHTEAQKKISDFDFVWMRKDPPVDEEFLATLHLLACTDTATTKVINSPAGLLAANEKMWALKYAPGFMPPTLVSSDQKHMYEIAKEFGKVVVKPLFQAGGAGVMVFESVDRNLKSALALLTNDGQKNAMLQKYVQNAEAGDKRIILVGGEPVGAMLRKPSKEDHRANLHVGGEAVKTEITDHEKKICSYLKPHLLSHGLYFVGIDVIDGYLTEVNVTSPTGLQEIDRLDGNTGKGRIRAKILDWIDRNLVNS